MHTSYRIKVMTVMVMTAVFCLLGSSLPVQAQTNGEVLRRVDQARISLRQWPAVKRIPALRGSLRRLYGKIVTAGPGWHLYTNDRNILVVINFGDTQKPPFEITALQTETKTFPDGSMAHYTCYCEDSRTSDDGCGFGTGSDGKPDLNNCQGPDCCGIIVHVVESDGTPRDPFPG